MMSSRIDVERLLCAANDDNFVAAVKDEMENNWALLPLEEFCLDGGSPECGISVSNVKKTRDNSGELTATFSVSFTEEIGSGCSDIPIERSRTAYCVLSIDKSNAEAHVSSEYEERRPEF